MLKFFLELHDKNHVDLHSNDIQDIMDAMMKETMNKTQEIPMDTDSDVTLQEVLVSPDNTPTVKSDVKSEVKLKLEVKEDNGSDDVKSEKANDGSIRVRHQINVEFVFFANGLLEINRRNYKYI